MEKNQSSVNKILQDLADDTKIIQKQQIIEFAVKYAEKFVKKCVQLKDGLASNKKIKVEDVRQTYEAMKMIRSHELTQKNQQKRKAIIQKANKQTFDKLEFKKILQTMHLNKQLQLTIQ